MEEVCLQLLFESCNSHRRWGAILKEVLFDSAQLKWVCSTVLYLVSSALFKIQKHESTTLFDHKSSVVAKLFGFYITITRNIQYQRSQFKLCLKGCKIQILSLFTPPYIVPNMYDYFSQLEHKIIYFEKCLRVFSP